MSELPPETSPDTPVEVETSPAHNNAMNALKTQTVWLNKIYSYIQQTCKKSSEYGLFKHRYTYSKTTQSFIDNIENTKSWPPMRFTLSYEMLELLKEKLERDGYKVRIGWFSSLRNVVFKVSWKPDNFVEVNEN